MALGKTSLGKVIKMILEENPESYNDSSGSNEKRLRRAFERLLEALGGDINELKAGSRRIEFEESELSFIMAIIRQLNTEDSVVNKLVDKNSEITYRDVSDFIQLVIDTEEKKEDVTDEELIELMVFMANMFSYAPLYFAETCHRLIDVLAANTKDLLSNEQAIHFINIQHMLEKEIAHCIAKSALRNWAIADLIEISKKVYEDDIGCQDYTEHSPELRAEYIKRDKEVLISIQEDEDLRRYVETKLGKKAEQIFNYAFKEK